MPSGSHGSDVQCLEYFSPETLYLFVHSQIVVTSVTPAKFLIWLRINTQGTAKRCRRSGRSRGCSAFRPQASGTMPNMVMAKTSSPPLLQENGHLDGCQIPSSHRLPPFVFVYAEKLCEGWGSSAQVRNRETLDITQFLVVKKAQCLRPEA